MIRKEIDDLMHRHPFQPFVIRLSSGEHYEVKDVGLAALLRSDIFIAVPNSDRRAIVPYLRSRPSKRATAALGSQRDVG